MYYFMGEAKTDDGTLYFEICGEGKPLVLICGLTGSVDYYWHTLIVDLSAHFQVIMFDARGVGKTKYSQNGFLIEHIAEDVAHLLDHLGIEKATIFGHSMGSAVAQEFARKFPNRLDGMILCNTFAKLNSRDCIVIEGILSLLEEKIPMKKIFWSLMPWIYSDKHLDNDDRKQKLKQFYEQRVISSLGFKHQIEALLVFDSNEWLNKIDSKTMVISSKEDIMIPPHLGEELAEKIKNTKYVLIDGGHAAHIEQPELVISLIKDFIGNS